MTDDNYNQRIEDYNQHKHYQRGRNDFKREVLDIIRPTLQRDPTMQKLMKAIEEME